MEDLNKYELMINIEDMAEILNITVEEAYGIIIKYDLKVVNVGNRNMKIPKFTLEKFIRTTKI